MALSKSNWLGDGKSARVIMEFDFMVVGTMDLELAVSLR